MECKDCKYYVPDDYPRFKGYCHRFPPFGLGNTDSDGFTTVELSDWCGEFKQKG